jgi:beta-lactam-binding protein with PASTA domain
MSRSLPVVVLVLVTAVAGCGGATGPVPDVTGDRLDVAKSELSDAGFDTEEIGGGTFGIINESNWTVCETDPPAGATGGGKVKLIVDRECSTTTTGGSSADEEPTPDSTPKATETPDPEPTAEVERVRVPDVRGMDHQAAQNRMQAVGLYNLRELDATGQGRLLIYDRNWTVVDQRPRPGARVSPERKITLISKKDGE